MDTRQLTWVNLLNLWFPFYRSSVTTGVGRWVNFSSIYRKHYLFLFINFNSKILTSRGIVHQGIRYRSNTIVQQRKNC